MGSASQVYLDGILIIYRYFINKKYSSDKKMALFEGIPLGPG
jgi:hypothetical protein